MSNEPLRVAIIGTARRADYLYGPLVRFAVNLPVRHRIRWEPRIVNARTAKSRTASSSSTRRMVPTPVRSRGAWIFSGSAGFADSLTGGATYFGR